MKDDRILLEFILQSIDRILAYTTEGEQAFYDDVIVHDYLGLDLPTVWSIISDELPPLRDKIERLVRL